MPPPKRYIPNPKSNKDIEAIKSLEATKDSLNMKEDIEIPHKYKGLSDHARMMIEDYLKQEPAFYHSKLKDLQGIAEGGEDSVKSNEAKRIISTIEDVTESFNRFRTTPIEYNVNLYRADPQMYSDRLIRTISNNYKFYENAPFVNTIHKVASGKSVRNTPEEIEKYVRWTVEGFNKYLKEGREEDLRNIGLERENKRRELLNSTLYQTKVLRTKQDMLKSERERNKKSLTEKQAKTKQIEADIASKVKEQQIAMIARLSAKHVNDMKIRKAEEEAKKKAANPLITVNEQQLATEVKTLIDKMFSGEIERTRQFYGGKLAALGPEPEFPELGVKLDPNEGTYWLPDLKQAQRDVEFFRTKPWERGYWSGKDASGRTIGSYEREIEENKKIMLESSDYSEKEKAKEAIRSAQFSIDFAISNEQEIRRKIAEAADRKKHAIITPGAISKEHPEYPIYVKSRSENMRVSLPKKGSIPNAAQLEELEYRKKLKAVAEFPTKVAIYQDKMKKYTADKAAIEQEMDKSIKNITAKKESEFSNKLEERKRDRALAIAENVRAAREARMARQKADIMESVRSENNKELAALEQSKREAIKEQGTKSEEIKRAETNISSLDFQISEAKRSFDEQIKKLEEDYRVIERDYNARLTLETAFNVIPIPQMKRIRGQINELKDYVAATDPLYSLIVNPGIFEKNKEFKELEPLVQQGLEDIKQELEKKSSLLLEPEFANFINRGFSQLNEEELDKLKLVAPPEESAMIVGTASELARTAPEFRPTITSNKSTQSAGAQAIERLAKQGIAQPTPFLLAKKQKSQQVPTKQDIANIKVQKADRIEEPSDETRIVGRLLTDNPEIDIPDIDPSSLIGQEIAHLPEIVKSNKERLQNAEEIMRRASSLQTRQHWNIPSEEEINKNRQATYNKAVREILGDEKEMLRAIEENSRESARELQSSAEQTYKENLSILEAHQEERSKAYEQYRGGLKLDLKELAKDDDGAGAAGGALSGALGGAKMGAAGGPIGIAIGGIIGGLTGGIFGGSSKSRRAAKKAAREWEEYIKNVDEIVKNEERTVKRQNIDLMTSEHEFYNQIHQESLKEYYKNRAKEIEKIDKSFKEGWDKEDTILREVIRHTPLQEIKDVDEDIREIRKFTLEENIPDIHSREMRVLNKIQQIKEAHTRGGYEESRKLPKMESTNPVAIPNREDGSGGTAREKLINRLNPLSRKHYEIGESISGHRRLISPLRYKRKPESGNLVLEQRDIAKMRYAGLDPIIKNEKKRSQYGIENVNAYELEIRNDAEGKRLINYTNEFWNLHNEDTVARNIDTAQRVLGNQENINKSFVALAGEDPEKAEEYRAKVEVPRDTPLKYSRTNLLGLDVPAGIYVEGESGKRVIRANPFNPNIKERIVASRHGFAKLVKGLPYEPVDDLLSGKVPPTPGTMLVKTIKEDPKSGKEIVDYEAHLLKPKSKTEAEKILAITKSSRPERKERIKMILQSPEQALGPGGTIHNMEIDKPDGSRGIATIEDISAGTQLQMARQREITKENYPKEIAEIAAAVPPALTSPVTSPIMQAPKERRRLKEAELGDLRSNIMNYDSLGMFASDPRSPAMFFRGWKPEGSPSELENKHLTLGDMLRKRMIPRVT